MKTIITTAVLLAVFAFAYPVAMCIGDPLELKEESTLPQNTEIDNTETDSSMDNEADINTYNSDTQITVKLLKDDGKIYDITMRDYLVSVVAAEMPVSFELDALKAQTVAARTYTMYNMLVRPSPAHPDADACADYKCCKAYIESEALKVEWGDAYNENMNKIYDAVVSTDGEYLEYDGSVALAVFHSSSAGYTESAEEVWNNAVPYLTSVESPETTDEVPNFKSIVTVSHKEFVDTVKAAYPDAHFGDELSEWVGECTKNASGRVDHICIGGVDISGTELRSMFDLRSAYFSLDLNGLDATFTVTGYGHGVGLSQYGANILANEGKTYSEILEWYYPGTELKLWK